MEPVTHLLTGACLGRAGLNRTTAYATLAATVAAEAPDLDMVTRFWGPVAEFEHHRGVTHTFLGAPFMALAITLIVFAFDRLRRKRPPTPVRWGYVWLSAFVADLSHILLDYTNSYGVRPLFPFQPHWYSRDIVFIFDPFIFVALLLGLLLPAIFGLVDQEMTRKRPLFRGRGFAIAALVGMVLVWVLRNAEHAHAIELARNAPSTRQPLLRVAAEPYPFDPFHWHVLAETPLVYADADVHTLGDRLDWNPDVTAKPPVTPAVAAAKQSYLGKVYEDWSTWPLTTDEGAIPAPGNGMPPPSVVWRTVQFTDMRFSYIQLLPGRDRPPMLAGWVYVGANGKIEDQIMGGREQH